MKLQPARPMPCNDNGLYPENSHFGMDGGVLTAQKVNCKEIYKAGRVFPQCTHKKALCDTTPIPPNGLIHVLEIQTRFVCYWRWICCESSGLGANSVHTQSSLSRTVFFFPILSLSALKALQRTRQGCLW